MEFILIWLVALRKRTSLLTALDPQTFTICGMPALKTAYKFDESGNKVVMFYYVNRLDLIKALETKHALRDKCTLRS